MLRGRTSAGLFFSLGLILSCLLFRIPAGRVFIPGGAACLAAAAALALLGLSPPASRRSGVLLLALALGTAAGLARLLPPALHRSGDARGFSWYEGVLLTDGRPAAGGDSPCLLRLHRAGGADTACGLEGRALVFISGGGRWFRGQNVRVRGRLDAVAEGREDGVQWIGRAAGEAARPLGFGSPLWRERARLWTAIGHLIDALGTPPAALFRALVLGDRDDLPEPLVRSFTRSGSLHLLALSGLHVGVLVLLATAVLRFLPERSWRVCAAALLALGYLFLVGARPSLSRAVAMLAAAAVGMALHREPAPLNLLALSAAVLLLVDPSVLHSLSFQLSYLALLGIQLTSRRAARALARFMPPAVGLPLAGSLGAGLFTAPVLLSAYGIVYPIGILAAPVLIPLVTLFIWVGVAGLSLFACFAACRGELAAAGPFLLWALRRVVGLLYRVIESVLELCSRAPGLVLDGRSLRWWLAGGLAALIFIAGFQGRRRPA